MNPASNLFIIGPTGAGKSSLGRALAESYGLTFIDLDQQIEQRTGVAITTLFEREGEVGFRAVESALLAELSPSPGIVLATGAGAILAAENRQQLYQHGYVIWLQASIDQQLERLQHDHTRPLLLGNRRAKLEAMAPLREPLYHATADLIIPGNDKGILATTKQSLRLLEQHWQRILHKSPLAL